ncbi:MAG: hypothetical protein GY795_40470 [Desulfobacterales bacterium]|nr:hypothetical protein [Desulfobacterales bacterium]
MTKERKYILIGGAILLFFAAIYRFGSDFEGFDSLEDDIALKEKKLAKYYQIVQEKSDLEAKHMRFNRALDRAEAGLLSGRTHALAAVDIQNILNDIAGRTGVEINSMRVLKKQKNKPEEEEDSVENLYTSVHVQITVSSTIRQLKEVIYKIESSLKLLRVTGMRIRLTSVRQVEKIYSTLTVEGFMKRKIDDET